MRGGPPGGCGQGLTAAGGREAAGWGAPWGLASAGPGAGSEPRLRSAHRLGRTKGAVQAALADDFNTPWAVDAVVELIHHGNRELKAAAEVAPQTRCWFGGWSRRLLASPRRPISQSWWQCHGSGGHRKAWCVDTGA